MDELTAAMVPSVEVESARDLVQAREDCRSDLMIERHRLRRQRFAKLERQLAFESAYETVAMTLALRDRHDAAIAAMAADSGFAPMVVRLGHLLGISTLSASGLAVEIGDWHGSPDPPSAPPLGLTPTEAPSGAIGSQRSHTKTGNTHARRLLVEAAWHHRRRNHAGKVMLNRWQQAPVAAGLRGLEGNHRLHARRRRFDARGKRPVIANVAIARKLAGWSGSLAVPD